MTVYKTGMINVVSIDHATGERNCDHAFNACDAADAFAVLATMTDGFCQWQRGQRGKVIRTRIAGRYTINDEGQFC